MEGKLDLILEQLKELNQIVFAIRDRQDESDAKLESLSMDVHKLNGTVNNLDQRVDKLDAKVERLDENLQKFRFETKNSFRTIEGHMRLVDGDLDEAMERIKQLEKART